MDAMGGGLNRKETSVTSDNVDSALDFLVRLDLGVLISRGSKRCKKHRNFPAAHEEEKGVIASGKLEKGERDSNSETFHCNPAG